MGGYGKLIQIGGQGVLSQSRELIEKLDLAA